MVLLKTINFIMIKTIFYITMTIICSVKCFINGANLMTTNENNLPKNRIHFFDAPTEKPRHLHFKDATLKTPPYMRFPDIFNTIRRAKVNKIEPKFVSSPTCKISQGSTLYKGTCERLLAKGSCKENEWLVLDDDNIPACKNRPCPWGQIYNKGNCLNHSVSDVCPSRQVLYVDYTGSSHCECEPGFLYDPWNNECIAEHTRGQCKFGKYIEMSNSGVIECVQNPCYIDGYVLIKSKNRCYKKLYTGKCEHNLTPYDSTETADCFTINGYNIFEVPTLRQCPRGSRRDFHNTCRRVFSIPVFVVRRSFHGKCNVGFSKDKKGNCKKVNRLFG